LEQATQLLDIATQQGVHGQLESQVGRECTPGIHVGLVSESLLLGDGPASIVQRKVAAYDLVGRWESQFLMTAGNVRDHRPVASFVSFDNAMRLPVELVTSG
jgi:hypothetical protein